MCDKIHFKFENGPIYLIRKKNDWKNPSGGYNNAYINELIGFWRHI